MRWVAQRRPDARELEVRSISKPFFGTLCSLIQAKLHGVSEGYLRYLKIQGIGYRASLQGAMLLKTRCLTLGTV